MEDMEEIELKYVPESDSNKNNQKDIPDNKTTCFLCLYKHNDNLPPNKATQTVSLFRICRYLNINLRDIISTNPSDTLVLSDNISNLFVSVCQECNLIVGNLSNLLEQLELLQMKVDHTLEKFTGILKDSEVNPSAAYHFQSLISSKGGEVPAPNSTIENLRAQITKICNKRQSVFLPNVHVADVLQKQILIKVDCQDDPNISPPSSPTPDIVNQEPSPSKSKSFASRKHLFGHRRQNHSKIESTEAAIRTCSLCSPKKTLHFAVQATYRRHKISLHYESYFISHKMPHLTPQDFKIYVEHVFKVELLSSKKKLNSSGVNSCQCPHCPHPFKEMIPFRNHLLTFHKQVMVKKLVELQKSTTVEQIQEIKLPEFCLNEDPQTDPNYYTCDICQPKRVIKIICKLRHLATYHMTTLFSASKINDNMAENDFKLYCDYLFDTEIKSSKRINDDKNIERIQCPECLELFSIERVLRDHLIRMHKQIMEEKLVKLQNSTDLSEITEKYKITALNMTERKDNEKRFSSKNLLSGINCEYCVKSFGSRYNLKRHLVNVHQVKEKSPEKKCMRSKPLTGISCEHCEKNFQSRANLKRHLITVHNQANKKQGPKKKLGRPRKTIVKQTECVEMRNGEDNNFEHSDEFMTKVEVPVSDGRDFFGDSDLIRDEAVDNDPLEI